MNVLDITRQIYADFAAGNIPAIVAQMANDVQLEAWADNSAQKGGVPWIKARNGKAGAMAFFHVVSELTIHEFTVLDIMASERQVAAEFVIEATTPDGARYRDEEMHLWSFNDAGKVTRLRHYLDTAKHLRAIGQG